MADRVRKITILAIVLVLTLSAAFAAEIDQSGGISLVVSFELDGDDPDSVIPVDAANAEVHYCETFRRFSADLYRTTEGRHWIRQVRFMQDLKKRDVKWMSKVGGGDDYGTYKSKISLRETVLDPPVFPADPTNSANYDPDHSTSESLGRLLNHEFGHFFYNLPDEYVNFFGFRGGQTGVCEGSYSPSPPTGTVCEEELPCGGNATCVYEGQCILGAVAAGAPCEADVNSCSPASTNAGAFCLGDDGCQAEADLCIDGKCADGSDLKDEACNDDEDCGGLCLIGCGLGGVCLGMNPSRDDRVSDQNQRLCFHETNLSVPPGNVDHVDSVCLMKGCCDRVQWCDGALDVGEQFPGSTHVFSLDDNRIYEGPNRNVTYDLENCPGPPKGDTPNDPNDDDCPTDYVGWSCWDYAKSTQPDLVNHHTEIGVYVSVGPPPAMNCQWLVDALPTNAHAALLVDASGSMDYDDLSFPSVQAVKLALDGALYFYKQIGLNDFAGVYVYDTDVDAATSDGSSLAFGIKTVEIETLDSVAAAGNTNIGLAIEEAHAAINAAENDGLPQESRNIVIFSDGKDNTPMNDPYLAAKAACDDDIFVHTIAFGDADSDALEKIAYCGEAWVTGTEDFTINGTAEPDPLELKTAMARMVHFVDGDVEIHESRAPLEPVTLSNSEDRRFLVPPGAEALEFTWLANRTCVRADNTGVPCHPVLNLFESVEVESPSGVIFQAPLPAWAESGVFRQVRVTSPEAGIWTARIDKTEPTPSPSTLPNEWADRVPLTRVSWVAHVEHPDLEVEAWVPDSRRSLTSPVVINAQMSFGPILTGLRANAFVTHAGNEWQVPMFDDGLHGDESAGDGTYGGIFNEGGTWAGVTTGAYRVKVSMQSQAGVSRGVVTGDYDPSFGLPMLRTPTGTAVAQAETSFRLSPRYPDTSDGDPNPGTVTMSCPDLVRGQTVPLLQAQVSGIPLIPDNTRIALRGVDLSVQQIECLGCANTAIDPSGVITFDADVPLDAPPGFHDLYVMDGFDILRQVDACRICTQPGVELCNGFDDDCNGLTDEDAAGLEDADLDGIAQVCDNCPFLPNVLQADFDSDGEGDRCDLNDGLTYGVFTSKTRFEWQVEGGSMMWNAYRGDLGVLRSTGVYTQAVGSNLLAASTCGLTVPLLDDADTIPPGMTACYLVSSVFATGEGDLGEDSSGSLRPNDNPCPGRP